MSSTYSDGVRWIAEARPKVSTVCTRQGIMTHKTVLAKKEFPTQVIALFKEGRKFSLEKYKDHYLWDGTKVMVRYCTHILDSKEDALALLDKIKEY